MSGGKIRIRMEAYDHQALDASAREIVDHAKRTGARVAGPAVLVEKDTATIVSATFDAEIHPQGHVVMTRKQGS